MKLIIALCLVAVALAAPQRNAYSSQDVQILRYNNEFQSPENYKYDFETSDGTKRQEEGYLRNAGQEGEALVVKGRYSWVAPDGQRYTISYVADDNGYQPEVEEGPGLSGAAVASLLG